MNKQPLRINMDETAVRTFIAPAKGLVSLPPKHRKAYRAGVFVYPAGRQQQRSCLTHVAFICDDSTIQTKLPHIIIGSNHVLSVRVFEKVRGKLRKNVFLWRKPNAWISTSLLLEIVEMLGRVLAPFLFEFQPILFWDALKCHLADSVLRAASQAGIWVIPIPAKMTWLLQPADTHAFAKYKAYIRKEFYHQASISSDGHVDLEKVIMILDAGVLAIFQATHWADSFDQNGFGGGQAKVRKSILEHLVVEHVAPAMSLLPSLAQVQQVWPKRISVPIDALFSAFLPQPKRRARAPPVAHMPESEASMAWADRLRPRRSLSCVSEASPPDLPGAHSPVRADDSLPPLPAWPLPPPAPPPPAEPEWPPRGSRLPGFRGSPPA